jgi:hypothetical protein
MLIVTFCEHEMALRDHQVALRAIATFIIITLTLY